MSFENGYNVFNYCCVEFQNYRADKNIFMKSLQALQFFQTRSDYPYCIKDMDFVIENILGVSITNLAMFERKYILEFDKRMFWDATDVLISEPFIDENPGSSLISDLSEEEGEKLVKAFKAEFQSFLVTISPLLDDLFYGESSTAKLAKVVKKPTFGKESTLRLIREDDQYFDIGIDDKAIDKICGSLLALKKNI